jgi:hypothetical protein
VNLYWNTGSMTEGTVMKVALGGGQTSTIAVRPFGIANIAIDATTLYWTEYQGRIMKMTPK